jgi:hypothetical protein
MTVRHPGLPLKFVENIVGHINPRSCASHSGSVMIVGA